MKPTQVYVIAVSGYWFENYFVLHYLHTISSDKNGFSPSPVQELQALWALWDTFFETSAENSMSVLEYPTR
ncbi:hypothetical protein HBI56_034010 [Parastagonospora nodorum]|nr:hypothetical protein HBH56_021810 [Parastagonospora nodorum]KAH3936985.1 hypothetical protein HBH54_012670 [Parastagonospora nodorum]KAH3967458.1 hypothetical protein HBH51_136420 [Parastagonospora nodorum]KAH4007108.1 hypothetical protein HBI10_012610 [Parastagonospora nodorum]KAH4011469.1 hypothetical protein HBI13_197980 [Parastagonospora nodorum]